jgi:hypothetical protein
MLSDARAPVRDGRRLVVAYPRASPPDRATPPNLTPRERELIQDWMARRYLQLHQKQDGRRITDLPMPASVRSSSQIQPCELCEEVEPVTSRHSVSPEPLTR